MLFEKLKNIIRSRLLTRDSPDQDWNTVWDDFNKASENNSHQSYTQSETGSFDSKEAGYYAALELKPGTAFPEIKAAYKRLVKAYHPDKYHNDEKKRKYAEQVTQKLNEAYRYFEDKFGQK
jgi:DnaJ-domain-containing protein 1